MKLITLLEEIEGAVLQGDPSTPISGLAYHTRDVAAGTLFCCVPGVAHDGHRFAGQAVAAGASALLCERETGEPVPYIIVPSVRRAMAAVAAQWYGHPSRELRVVGITGTNGKTTTSYLIARIFEEAGLPSGLLGTVVNRIGGREWPVQLTTPESLDLQRMFGEMVEAGDKACVFEVSSHALSQERSAAISFDAVVFSNLTRDHLDYHSDFEDYFAAKRRLFLPEEGRNGAAVAVVNTGDRYGERLAAECSAVYRGDLWTYALEGAAEGAPTALARSVEVHAHGSSFILEVPRLGVSERVSLLLTARFNVENALAAATTALALGLPLQAVLRALAGVEGVPGRFQAVRAGQPFGVLVDYAHTPDSLENALAAARDLTVGRLIVVFGCGGDRDRGKRPLMGEIAARLADLAVVTSDNPRTEEPSAIIADILSGISPEGHAAVSTEEDRRAAIAGALRGARAGDTVLIAGKGHEQGQIVGRERLPFDDRTVALEVLAELFGGEEGS